GNVALDNLQIKENALSELDVPFRIKVGQIDKLTLKIPWKNLYGEAVVATLEGLYLLVVPGASIKYDAEKEEKYLQDNKQKELARIEEALQKAAEKGTHSQDSLYGLESLIYKDAKPGRKRKKYKKHFKRPFKSHDRSKDKPKEEKKDTFLEKLATQVIKNVQVKITGIHVKYEDDITDPQCPISLGMTLSELSLLTTNENWTPSILNEAAKIIYKLLRLDSLSAYWNVHSKMYYHGSREQILDQLKRGIPCSGNQAQDYQYIFRPVSASARLCINPYAEVELKSPKIDCNVEVQRIVIEFTKPQYLSMIDLLESIDYMVRNAPYRRFRPDVPLHENARQWWSYAGNSVLEVHIKRHTRMWSWSNIKQHRQLLKSYKSTYKSKLTQSKLSEETQKQIQDLEKKLDVFSIILARQQAQVETIRSGQKLLKKKSGETEKKSSGWFGGFWGRRESRKKEDEESSVPETIDELMTPEEKAKLFTAIGYSDSSRDLSLPKQYVAHVVTLKLLSTSLTIKEDKNVAETLKVQIIDLSTKISQRPGAQAIKVEAKLENWYVTGLKQENIVPSLVASIGDSRSSLLKIEFDINPEDSTADQSLTIESQPVEIKYDARTINAMVEFFQTSKGMDLERLTSATLMKLEEIKERTASGLAHIIEMRKVLDLKINLKPSYLVVPQTGFYHEKSDLLILDFGTFQLNSINQGSSQASSFSSLEEIMDKAYDKFDVKIKNVQLLFGRAGEDWKKARFQHPSTLHILQPMDFHVQLAKSMVERDTRMAKFKVSGELPLVHVRLSDRKIKAIFDLIDSIPLPQKSSVSIPSTKVPSIPAIGVVRKTLLDTPQLLAEIVSDSEEEYLDFEGSSESAERSLIKGEEMGNKEPAKEELTDLQLKFEIKEVLVELTRQKKTEETVLVFDVMHLGTEATVGTYNLAAVSYLKKISLDYYEIGGKKAPIHLISSSDKLGVDLLKVEYIKADRNGPHFQTVFDNTEQKIQVAFSSLNLLLHTEALMSALSFLTAVSPLSSGSSRDTPAGDEKQEDDPRLKKGTFVPSKDKDIFDFKLFAKLDAFCLNICDEKKNIAEIKIQGLDSSLLLQPSHTAFFARLKDIVVTDVDSRTLHKKAVSIVGDEVFSFNLTLDPCATEGEAYTDMSKVDGTVSLKVGCIQIVYLHKFLMSLLTFMNNFQTAKEALSAATVQAAEKAATSVKDLAQRSFRLAMDIHLKAPVIVIPESSVSPNAIVIDLGLIKVQNQFSLVSPEGSSLPPVIDKMDVQLTKLKLSRTTVESDLSHQDIQILHPINLSLSVKRNLSAAWFHKLPMLEVTGRLDTMNVVLSQEDLSVFLKVLTENLGEAEEKPTPAKSLLEKEGKTKEVEKYVLTQDKSVSEGMLSEKTKKAVNGDVIHMLLNFEIKEVVITLMKQVEKERYPLHILTVLQLGTETKIRSHELTAAAYLKKITVRCVEINDSKGDPLYIINSSSETNERLLKMEYIKADADGPDFVTTYRSTKQNINVMFSCLDIVLHTEALLSILSFLTFNIPSDGLPSTDKASDHKPQIKEQEKGNSLRPVSSSAACDDIYELKLTAKLNAFNITVCDQTHSIADIRIQGMDASVAMKTKKIQVFSRLEDIVITNADPKTIHKKAVSIMGDEVFRFHMSLYPDATAGEAYADMSRVDGKMSLKVGCIQIIYLHGFFMSLLNFLNNFRTAQEALTAVTVQAAEMAASSMKDFAKKSFRLLMDVNLKAPVIVVPESSTSCNALVADLGLIRVQNEFKLVSSDESSLPPVIDNMDVQLTHLKLSRCITSTDSQPDSEILCPVSLTLLVQRNLAATWYHKTPTIGIKGDLKPMQIALSEEDLTVIMKILLENLGGASSQPNTVRENIQDTRILKGKVPTESSLCEDPLAFGQENVSTAHSSVECYTALKFDFNFESLSVTLYSRDMNQKCPVSLHNDKLRLGELRLHLMASSAKMFSDGSMDINVKLKACTLDDLREGIQNVTARMIDKKDDTNDSSMIDISYKQDKSGTKVIAVLDKLYVCASMEFLLTVADFFIHSMPATSTARSTQFQLKHTASGKCKSETEISMQPNMTVKAVIMDPEIVFVANLTNADAPALKVSFQCDFSLTSEKTVQRMTAQVKGFKVLACAFLKEKQDKNVTTVLQPCSLVMENMVRASGMQSVVVTVEELVIKISPIILNTVMTIMAAIKPKATEEASRGAVEVPENLWQVKPIDECNAWFLGVDVATEATEAFMDREHVLKPEEFDIVVKSVQITLECGLGHRTVPLLLVESVFSGVLKNWSSLTEVTANMSLEVHYYNETYAVWEPLIERIEGGKKQWSLKLEMKTNPVQERSLMPGDDFIVLPDPQTAVNISSKDTMNITISKCSLAVFSNLAKAFSEGTASTYDYSFKETAPFIVKNALGVPLKVLPSSSFRIVGSVDKENVNEVGIGQNMELEYAVFETPQRGKLSALYRQESSIFSVNLELQGYKEVVNIPIAKPGRRLYNIKNLLVDRSDSIIVQIDATEGNKVITIRSPLQIKNHFSVPFVIYKLSRDSKSLEPIGISKPEEEFHVPLHSYRCHLYVQPTGTLQGQFRESTTYIAWREELHRSTEVKCLLQCPASETNILPLVISSTAVPDELNFISSYGEEWDPAYIIHLYPTLTVRNLLPYSLRYLLEGTAEIHELTEGSAADVFQSRIGGEIMEFVLMKYQGKDWNGHLKIWNGMPEFFSVCCTSQSGDVDIYIHTRRIGSRIILSVFSPYWIINKTSRVLQYRAEDTHVKHPADYRDIVLFSFKKKNIFSKNKIQLCISTSGWSSSFSLDTVGSYGCVRCSANNMDYLVGVSIKMSSFNLTRIVTFTPFYTIANKSSLELEVGEIGPDGSFPTNKWNYISSSECLPFWPENSSGELCVRVVGYGGSSKPFLFKSQDNGTLLRLEESHGGLLVDVNVSDHSTVISFSDYHEGAAPALIVNHTSWDSLRYKQSGLQGEMELKPNQVCLFAWTDPTKTRKLTWGYSQNFGEHDLLKDGCGQFPYNANTQIHWVSFLDGRQRVLLFTDDVALVSKARQAEELEQPDQEINLSIHSLGLSLVNNENKKEISYIGITSSGVVWELKPKQKWKPFNQKQINLLEQAYQNHLSGGAAGWNKLDGNFEVNFSKVPMEMRLPIRCSIRRNFLSGIQVEFKQSPHQRSLRAQLYWLQVDNQLPGSMFPVVFHPVAPPKSIAMDSEPKPFIDISVITRFNEYSKVLQFKYFMVLIQEMAVKIDQGFLGALSELFTPSTDPEAEKQRSKLIQQDIDALSTELMESSLTDLSMLSFFEYFHISPIKLHLSLSLACGGEASESREAMIAIRSLNLLLKSIGATLTDVDDLIFKLAFFEIKYQFYKRDQLMKRVVRHYSEQLLKQMYVLVLGLDVLGNPFGLIRGLSEGVEAFFYEPFQGAVQGPEEFAEGIVIGVKSLVGHTVGGAAGMMSRITGSVGKGLAAITMDKEFQQKRREEMGRQPKDFGDSLAKGGKGLLWGVVEGVTGVVTKPVEGAKKEGAAGFFKGIGKGLVGVVARPTGGIVDMASSTFQGIQRVAESTEEVSNLRPPRFIHEDGIIRPYNRVEAEGYELFEKLHTRKLEKESYRYHCALPGARRANLMVTNRRVICVKEVEILGHLATEWDYLFEDITRCPSYEANVVKLTVLEQRMFQRKDSTGHECVKAVKLRDEAAARRICRAIQEAQATRKQQKLVKRASLQLRKPQ
ncbi:Vacuolar protein sorting-associated protein 13C, partial [Cuculus canorus]